MAFEYHLQKRWISHEEFLKRNFHDDLEFVTEDLGNGSKILTRTKREKCIIQRIHNGVATYSNDDFINQYMVHNEGKYSEVLFENSFIRPYFEFKFYTNFWNGISNSYEIPGDYFYKLWTFELMLEKRFSTFFDTMTLEKEEFTYKRYLISDKCVCGISEFKKFMNFINRMAKVYKVSRYLIQPDYKTVFFYENSPSAKNYMIMTHCLSEPISLDKLHFVDDALRTYEMSYWYPIRPELYE